MSDRASLVRVLVLGHRYSLDITDIAGSTLGQVTSNAGVQLMLAIHRSPDRTPSEVAQQLGVSRAGLSHVLTPLVRNGMVERRPNPADERAVTLSLAPAGRDRMRAFELGLADYYRNGTATVKAVLHELDLPASEPPVPAEPVPAMTAMSRMADVGARYVEQVNAALAPFAVHSVLERYALCLLSEFGNLRPSQLADELHLSSSGATDLVTRLEIAGLVRRSHEGDDGRSTEVSLTLKGRHAVTALLRVFRRHAPRVAEVFALTLRVAPPSV